jgi:hypothetical protein
MSSQPILLEASVLQLPFIASLSRLFSLERKQGARVGLQITDCGFIGVFDCGREIDIKTASIRNPQFAMTPRMAL